MKKIFILLLVIILTALCAACGGTLAGGQKSTGTPSSENAASVPDDSENTYIVTDYYNEDGTYSDLGRSIPFDSSNGERMLAVGIGDVIIVSEQQYKVAAESLKLPFYTQSSLNEVIVWWTEYMNSAQERGDIIEVK